MNEIKCPRCGEVFQVDEAGYAAILQQVRNQAFTDEINSREEALRQSLQTQLKLFEANANEQKQKELAEKEQQILRLQEQSKAAEEQKQHAVQMAEGIKNQQILRLNDELLQLRQQLEALKQNANLDKQNALQSADSRHQSQIAQKDQQIAMLEAQINQSRIEQSLAVQQATQSNRETILRLQSDLQHEKDDRTNKERELTDHFKTELAMREEQIVQLRDFKTRLSTKMVGESLEQHCFAEFNKVRMMAFPNAQFAKDNDARTGSKGDFIFREETEDGTPLLSIMFEMKNEMDTTAAKHRNEDFFKELDKDRKEKDCEYAILVSMLEADSELYNSGIVDVSYAYPKMFVIRPQFFIPIISLLRNAALSSVQYRKELAMVKAQNVDVSNFEAAMAEFKKSFGYNYEQAHKRFDEAIIEINKAIRQLENVREALTKSDAQLGRANDKVEDLTIKKLVRGNPTMRELFIQAGADVTK